MDTEAAGGVDSSTLLPDVDEFETELEAGTSPVAVVGPPFAGRERLLERSATVLDAEQVRLGPGATPATVTDALGDGPLVVEGCHHLYSRQIGGFADLETVLDSVVAASETVVTGWNSYAWAYLDAVRDVDGLFRGTFEVRDLPVRELADVVRERATALPAFRNDSFEERFVERREMSVGAGRLRVPVRIPVPRGDAIRARIVGSRDPEQAVFEQLAAVTDGNPGVAFPLWGRVATEGEIRPSDVDPPALEMDREDAFVLRRVLESERLDRDRLDGAGRLLERLADRGIVALEGGTVRIEPLGVPAAVEATERWRIL